VGTLLDAWTPAHGSEPCGLLLGTIESGVLRVQEAVAVRNSHSTPDRAFQIRPEDQAPVLRDAPARGLQVVGTWHGHLRGGPFPGWQDHEGFLEASRVSPTGVGHALVIVGRGTAGRPVLRAFVPDGRRLREIPLRS
jgi:proteasome lid subunit RPN8/RPN11